MFETPPFPADAPRFGDGRFVIVSRIGQGRSGAVYRGYDLAHGEWRAFKLLSVELASDWEAWDRFVRDGLLLARTVHPNLVRVHEVVGGRAPFLVMDLVTGGTLQRWTDRHGAMPPRMACTAVMEVARGVAAIHASGGVHGAIGPANVLVTHHGARQLSDLSANHDPDERSVDVAALGDLLRRLCGSDLPPKLAVIASGCGVGSLQIAADVAEALDRVRVGLAVDPPATPEAMLTTTGGERLIRVAALPPDLARLLAEPGVPSSLEPTQPHVRPEDTAETLRFGRERTDSGTLAGWAGWPSPDEGFAAPGLASDLGRREPARPPRRPSQDVTEPLDDVSGWVPARTPPPEPDEVADPDSVTVPTLTGPNLAGPNLTGPNLTGPARAEDPPETTGPTTPLGPARLARGRLATPEVGRDLAGRSAGARSPSPVPVSAQPRRVAAPPATAEQPRAAVHASPGYDEVSNPDYEVTDRAEPIEWSLESSGGASGRSDTRTRAQPAQAQLPAIHTTPAPALPARDVPLGSAALTPEPPPLPPHLRGAVAPVLVDDAEPPTPAPAAPAAEAAPGGWTGCLSLVMVPASAAFGLSLAVLAVAILVLATAARDVAGAAAATDSTRIALHQTLQQHAVLIDRLPASAEDRAVLEAAFGRYSDAATEPGRTEAALALLEAVDKVATLHEDGAELSYRVRQMRSARTDYLRAVEAWQVAAATARGRLVVGVGLAAGPEISTLQGAAVPSPAVGGATR